MTAASAAPFAPSSGIANVNIPFDSVHSTTSNASGSGTAATFTKAGAWGGRSNVIEPRFSPSSFRRQRSRKLARSGSPFAAKSSVTLRLNG